MRMLRMPRRFLRGSTLGFLLTAAALAAGVALVCAIDLVNRAVYTAFAEVMDTMAGRASLHVTAGGGALVPEDVATIVAGVPGVVLAVPVVDSWAFTTDGSGEQLAVHGIDVGNDAAVRVYEPSDAAGPTMDDPLFFLSQRDSVIVTETFATARHLTMDDPLDLETPTGRKRFVVRGILAPRGIATVQGGNLIVMDIAAAELVFTKPGLASRIDVVVDASADRDSVRGAIAAALPPGLRVDTPEQRRIDVSRVLASLQTLLSAVSLLGLVAAFFIAFSRLSALFERRVGQLAILRAVGVRRRWVTRELLAESALVALAGIGIGLPLGIGLAHVLGPVNATTTAIAAKLVRADAVVRVRPESIATAVVLGITTVMLAALLPARRAARLPIVETLRERTIERAARHAPPTRTTVAAVTGVTGFALVTHLVTGNAELGLAASALVVALIALGIRPILAAAAPMLTALAPRVAGGVGRYAVATLVRAPRRTALTVATIAVGFGTVVWLWTLAASFEESIVEVMPGVLHGDLAVSSLDVGAGYVEAPLDDTVLADVAAVPGVAAVVGEQTADWEYAGGPIALNAFDPRYFDTRLFGTWRFVGHTADDAAAAVAAGRGVLVSENFVHNLGGAVGDALQLDSPSGALRLPIVGVVADFLSPRGTVLMSRDLYRARWRDAHLTHALVVATDPAQVSDVRTAIAAALRTRHVRVLPTRELVEWFADQARRAFASLHVLGGFVLLVVLVGVGDALTAGMLERTRELGIVRALGARRRTVRRTVLVEALVLALFGSVAALVVGLCLGVLWVEFTFASLVGWTLSLHVPLAQIGVVLLGVFGVCTLAAWLPAARAARLDPAFAIRTE
jgi:putative ABC transport system permease protein